MTNNVGARYYEVTLTALRVMAGWLFSVHGGQKLFAWFGAEHAFTTWWPVGVAGVIEFRRPGDRARRRHALRRVHRGWGDGGRLLLAPRRGPGEPVAVGEPR